MRENSLFSNGLFNPFNSFLFFFLLLFLSLIHFPLSSAEASPFSPFCSKKLLDAQASRFQDFKETLQHPEHQQLWSEYKKEYETFDQEIHFKDYNILFVRGVFSNLFIQFMELLVKSPLTFAPPMLNPFFDQIQWLKKTSHQYHIVPHNTLQGVDEVKEIIAQYIRDSSKQKKKVIIISHSRGGLDVLHTLVDYPDLHELVAGWISLESLFKGTPLLDCLVNCRGIGPAFKLLVKSIGGSEKTVRDMETEVRQRYHEKNQERIRHLSTAFPIISVGGYFVPSATPGLLPFSQKSFLEELNCFILSRGGGINDGMVPAESSCLEGSQCLYLDDMDHLGPVMGLSPFKGLNPQERETLTKTLLAMLLKRIH